ncbi:hypothetical protein PGTUg99_037046 [Puccinia graminis f. sp. tritici]|uniref:Uncharacterized protein n=1 Tax=Puccinia graminis f. sp. tritici TaxID=56615 RepID=A0A5B0R9E9_PUCGR|nr:hypothetical protein PGTUg99_037046 [Puccinia graminis f. sp. tritici]
MSPNIRFTFVNNRLTAQPAPSTQPSRISQSKLSTCSSGCHPHRFKLIIRLNLPHNQPHFPPLHRNPCPDPVRIMTRHHCKTGINTGQSAIRTAG